MEAWTEPAKFLKRLTCEFLADDGTTWIACPHFLTPRGYVWMALATLLDLPMYLSDLPFIHPWHMKEWATALSMDAELVTTLDGDLAYGLRLLKDFDKCLRNALPGAKLTNSKVDD